MFRDGETYAFECKACRIRFKSIYYLDYHETVFHSKETNNEDTTIETENLLIADLTNKSPRRSNEVSEKNEHRNRNKVFEKQDISMKQNQKVG